MTAALWLLTGSLWGGSTRLICKWNRLQVEVQPYKWCHHIGVVVRGLWFSLTEITDVFDKSSKVLHATPARLALNHTHRVIRGLECRENSRGRFCVSFYQRTCQRSYARVRVCSRFRTLLCMQHVRACKSADLRTLEPPTSAAVLVVDNNGSCCCWKWRLPIKSCSRTDRSEMRQKFNDGNWKKLRCVTAESIYSGTGRTLDRNRLDRLSWLFDDNSRVIIRIENIF